MSFELFNDLSIYDEILVTRASRCREETVVEIDSKVQQMQQITSPVLRTIIEIDWMKNGSCLGMTDGTMFPNYDDAEGIEAAKEVCQGCPVINACVEDALEKREKFGVRGGLSELERSKVLRQRKRDTDKQVALSAKTIIA